MKTYTGSSDILNIYVSFDSGAYEFVGSVSSKTGIAVTEFPLRPVRANYMQVKIQASGQGFSIISLSREFITHDDYN